ncbi:hypothetical protein FRB97_009354 [Tulasnella sp. 331]|nr:hypothetical protein FRB97_009354 [Tulasnella sp. 331]
MLSSRFLRRHARAKLVDNLHYHLVSPFTRKMGDSGVMDEEAEMYEGYMPGIGGFAAAGEYVAYMARGMLRKAVSEVSKDEEPFSARSSENESMLSTPKDQNETALVADVPSDCGTASTPLSHSSLHEIPIIRDERLYLTLAFTKAFEAEDVDRTSGRPS